MSEHEHLAPAAYIPLPDYMESPLMQWARFLEGDGAGGTTPAADGTPPEGDGAPPAGDPPPGDGDEQDPEGAEALGEPGKRALAAMKEQRDAEKQKRRALEAEVARLKAPKDGEQLTPDQLRDQIRAEVAAEFREPLWKSAVRASATELGFHDPADASRYLDLKDFEPDASGTFDADEIHDKLSELLGKKPWLAKTPAGQPGNGDGGRKVPPPPANRTPKAPSLDDQIAEAHKAGDARREMQLQLMKTAQQG